MWAHRFPGAAVADCHQGGLTRRKLQLLIVETRISMGGAGSFRELEETVPGLFPSLWALAGDLWRPLACRLITLILASTCYTWRSPCVRVCVHISPSYKGGR